MKHRMGLLAGGVVSVLVLAGCGSKEDANARNFGAAISQYLEKTGDLCLGWNFKRWPVDLIAGKSFELAPRMEALEAAKLVSSENTVVDDVSVFGRTGLKVAARRYNISDKGKAFYRSKSAAAGSRDVKSFGASDFCYGKMALGSVVKWDGPVTRGSLSAAMVTYTYTINDLADWVKEPAIAAAFPDTSRVLSSAGAEQRLALKLSSAGWEVDNGY